MFLTTSSPSRSGRKGYDKVLVICWLMYKQTHGCTYRDLESMSGIDHSTFIKFRQRLMQKSWFPDVFQRLVDWLISRSTNLQLIIDSSFVETYSKKDEAGSEYFGFKEKNGFKLHQVIDFETRLPLVQECTPGARSDVVLGRRLITQIPAEWPVSAVLADKGYDSDDLVVMTKMKWQDAEVAIPMRRTNQEKRTEKAEVALSRKKRGSNRSRSKTLYKRRTAIERFFSRMKGVFHLGTEKTRGLRNFETNCLFINIMKIFEYV